ncbi:hypothetical protein [Candidatus Nitrosocosmicus sp. R]
MIKGKRQTTTTSSSCGYMDYLFTSISQWNHAACIAIYNVYDGL